MYARTCTACIRSFVVNHTATADIYTLSLHDALPIWRAPARVAVGDDRPDDRPGRRLGRRGRAAGLGLPDVGLAGDGVRRRLEEHTSELQSRQYLVCRLLLEKNNKHRNITQLLRRIIS